MKDDRTDKEKFIVRYRLLKRWECLDSPKAGHQVKLAEIEALGGNFGPANARLELAADLLFGSRRPTVWGS